MNLLLPDAPPSAASADAPARTRWVDDGATAADRVTSSVVRDLLHLAERGGVISLAGGLPDVSLLDPDRFQEASDAATAVTGPNGPVALQYGPTHGLAVLREALADHHTRRGTPTTPDEVLVTRAPSTPSPRSPTPSSGQVTAPSCSRPRTTTRWSRCDGRARGWCPSP